MTRFVVGPDAALRLAGQKSAIPNGRQLLAPTLLRSQVLAALYGRVRSGALDRKAAEAQLDYLRGLQIRLLGDRVLQAEAWKVADRLGLRDTFVAEYVALTRLQADALVVEDKNVAAAVSGEVRIATLAELLA